MLPETFRWQSGPKKAAFRAADQVPNKSLIWPYSSVYENETSLYYLQSRYYDPQLGRFINADDTRYLGADGTSLSYNLFLYCKNNPVILLDDSGNSAVLATIGVMAVGGIIGSVVSAASSVISQKALTGEVNWKSVGVAAATGLVSGAVAASPLGIGYQIGIGGALGGASYIADCYVNNKAINLGEAGAAIVAGFFSGALGGPGANKGGLITDAIEYAGKTAAREARRANSAYAAKAIARATYYASNVVASSAWEASIRFSAGCGASNTLTGQLGNMGIFSSCPTISLW